MSAYNAQRVGAATVALGIAQGAYEQALAYSGRREQFGRPICEFQGLQWMLADMATQLAAARALIHQAADCGAGFPDVLEAAQAKVFARSEEHTSELQSLMRISYAVFCL